jgi:hypothetical protein
LLAPTWSSGMWYRGKEVAGTDEDADADLGAGTTVDAGIDLLGGAGVGPAVRTTAVTDAELPWARGLGLAVLVAAFTGEAAHRCSTLSPCWPPRRPAE